MLTGMLPVMPLMSLTGTLLCPNRLTVPGKTGYINLCRL